MLSVIEEIVAVLCLVCCLYGRVLCSCQILLCDNPVGGEKRAVAPCTGVPAWVDRIPLVEHVDGDEHRCPSFYMGGNALSWYLFSLQGQ